MSLPHFDDVTFSLRPSVVEGEQMLEVSGPLEKDEEERVVYVFVVIQQTPKDLALPGSSPSAVVIAKAAGAPVTVPAGLATAKWRATMTLPAGQPQFGSGSATGTALAVEYSVDEVSVGFETYIWTQRIELG
jgi:hypothetical protein